MEQPTHLLTGFPSFLGRRMLKGILDDEDARALCLVPPNAFPAAERDLRALGEASSRVELIEGHPSSMHLGLSSKEYERIRRETTVIHHLPQLDSGRSKNRWAPALRGTENLLELAGEAPALERFSQLSSINVMGPEPATEEAVPPSRDLRTDTDALAAIERKVHAAKGDVPVTIFRPSQIIGDSRTGEVARPALSLEAALRLALPPFRIPLPQPGFGKAPFHAVPADWIAAAVLLLTRRESTVGKTFHLIDPDPRSLRWVWEQVARKLGRDTLSRLLRDDGSQKVQQTYSCTNTLEQLVTEAERCPPLPSYLDRMIAWAEAQVGQRQTAGRSHRDPLL